MTPTEQPDKSADVFIIGAGILGLMNALQYAKRGIRVVVVDNLQGQKRSYKVGESLLIFSTMFFRTIGGLDEFLQESFPKHGVWFVHGMEGERSFEGKPEFAFAGRTHPWVSSMFRDPLSFRCELEDCHIVRPEAEDLLVAQVRAHPNITLVDAARVKDVALGEGTADHAITWECLETRTEHTTRASWILDCSGRGRFLTKRFGHAVPRSTFADDLQTTAVWAQFDGIDDGMFEAWRTTVAKGVDTRRDLSTVHL
ncbi:MAG TPA: FAD-dependent monooxygenase, partial [Kofleriaceae bacterium]